MRKNTLQIIGTTFIYTWIYQETGGSILAAMVFHAAGNSFAALIPFLPLVETGGNIYAYGVFIALIWIIALAITVRKLGK